MFQRRQLQSLQLRPVQRERSPMIQSCKAWCLDFKLISSLFDYFLIYNTCLYLIKVNFRTIARSNLHYCIILRAVKQNWKICLFDIFINSTSLHKNLNFSKMLKKSFPTLLFIAFGNDVRTCPIISRQNSLYNFKMVALTSIWLCKSSDNFANPYHVGFHWWDTYLRRL